MGTLGLASLALQAQVQNRIKLFLGQPVGPELAGKSQPEGVGPASGDIGFVSRRHIGWTHGPGQGLPAGPYSGALLCGAGNPSEIGKIVDRLGLGATVVGGKPQILRDRRRMHNFSGVEDPFRIKCGLQLAEGLVEDGSIHPAPGRGLEPDRRHVRQKGLPHTRARGRRPPERYG